MSIVVFWVVTPCSLVGGRYHLYPHHFYSEDRGNISSETLVTTYTALQTRRPHSTVPVLMNRICYWPHNLGKVCVLSVRNAQAWRILRRIYQSIFPQFLRNYFRDFDLIWCWGFCNRNWANLISVIVCLPVLYIHKPKATLQAVKSMDVHIREAEMGWVHSTHVEYKKRNRTSGCSGLHSCFVLGRSRVRISPPEFR
jgi:hypothetical protein